MNRELTFPAGELNGSSLGLAEICDLLYLSFPKKLWKMVESDHFKSISWNDDGDCVVTEEEFFQREVWDRKGLIRIFETSRLKSFIRQLNLYGFSKIHINWLSIRFHQGTKKIMAYRNSNFRRDCPFLIERMRRRVGIRSRALSSSASPFPKRKRVGAPKEQISVRGSRMAHYSKGVISKKEKKKVLKKSQHTQKKRSDDYHAPLTWPLENSASRSRQNLPQVRPREVQNSIGLNPFIPQEPPTSIDIAIMGLVTPSLYHYFMSLNAQIMSLISLYNLWFPMCRAGASTVRFSEPREQQISSSAQPRNCYNSEPSAR
ncbi:uncharacterized protein LOC144455055 [Phascolarctos cinereus]